MKELGTRKLRHEQKPASHAPTRTLLCTAPPHVEVAGPELYEFEGVATT
jgi:hypothetical protein